MTDINDAASAYKSQRNVSNDSVLEQESVAVRQLDDQQEARNDSVTDDILTGLGEAPWQIAGGIGDFGNELWNFMGLDSATDYVNSKFPALQALDDATGLGQKNEEGKMEAIPPVEEPKSTTGRFIRSTSQFMAGFLPMLGPAQKLSKASKVAKTTAGTEIISGGIAGAVTDVVGFDPKDPNVANLINGMNPESQNVILDFLATDDNDPDAINRLKNALVGTMIGTVAEPAVRGLSKAIGRLKGKLKGKSKEEVLKMVDNNLDKEAKIIDDFDDNALRQEETVALKEAEEATDSLKADIKEPNKELIDSVASMKRVSPEARKEFDAAIRSGNYVEASKHMDFNLDKIDSPENIKEILNTATDVLNKAGEGKVTITHKETEELAQFLGSSPEALRALGDSTENLAARLLAGRQMLLDSTSRLEKMADIITTEGGTNRQLLRYQKGIETHLAIQKTVSGVKGEVGRALNAMKIKARGEDARLAAMDSILISYGGKDSITLMAGRMSKLAKMPDGAHRLNAMFHKGTVAKSRDAMLEMYIQGLLSNPKTQFINAVGNTVAIGMTVAERKIAETLARYRGQTGGVARGEHGAQLQGMIQGTREGWKIFKEAFKSGEPDSIFSKTDYYKPYNKALSAEAWEAKGMMGKAMDYMSSVTNLPGRTLMSADEMFKTINYRSEVYAQAYRKLSGMNLDPDEFSKAFKTLIDHPSEDITMKALDVAHLNTFTNPLGKHARGIQQVLERDPTGVAKVFVPFFRTPVNLLKFATARTPGLRRVLGEIRDEISSPDLATRQLAEAKFASGAMIYTTAMGLAMSGNITGAPPADHQVARRLRETGWKPYSIKIGKDFIPYNRFDPIGMMIGFSADMYQTGTATQLSREILANPELSKQKEEEANGLVTSAIGSIWKNLEERHYLHGISNLLQLVAPDTDYARERASKEMLNVLPPISFYSSFRRGVAKTIDPVRRNVEDNTDVVNEITNRILASTPGMSDQVHAHYNMVGEKSLYPSHEKGLIARGINNLVNPFGDVGDTSDAHPLIRKIADLGIDMEGMEGIQSIGGVDLEPDEVAYYARVWGNLNKKLTDYVTSARFEKMPEGTQSIELEAEIRSNKGSLNSEDGAIGATLEQFPRIREELQKMEVEAEAQEQQPTNPSSSPLFQLRSN